MGEKNEREAVDWWGYLSFPEIPDILLGFRDFMKFILLFRFYEITILPFFDILQFFKKWVFFRFCKFWLFDKKANNNYFE